MREVGAAASVAPGFGSGLRRGDPSRTAMMAATARGIHRFQDSPPWVFDDPYALSLVGPAWPDLLASMRPVLREPVLRQTLALQLARPRYAEDRLTDSFSQYVILGAGLDSFAWRRPHLLSVLRVFEVDHPATQENGSGNARARWPFPPVTGTSVRRSISRPRACVRG